MRTLRKPARRGGRVAEPGERSDTERKRALEARFRGGTEACGGI